MASSSSLTAKNGSAFLKGSASVIIIWTERKDDESKRARFGTDASGGEGNFYASVIVDDDER